MKIFKPIKDFLFTHPEYEGGSIDLSTIIFVMSIPLRDKYLGKHPEIDPRTLDQKES